MSHFTHIKTQIKDIAALKATCNELGFQLLENTTARGYGSNKIHGDYVIRLTGPYDVALQRQQDGNYQLTADLWCGHVEREVGKDFGTLKQFYGVHKTTIEARRKGLTVRRHTLQNGSIRLNLCRV